MYISRQASTIPDFRFGGSGFALPANASTYGSVSSRNTAHSLARPPGSSDLEMTQQSIQRVPETPAWQAPQVPSSVDCRLDFSCEPITCPFTECGGGMSLFCCGTLCASKQQKSPSDREIVLRKGGAIGFSCSLHPMIDSCIGFGTRHSFEIYSSAMEVQL